MFIKFLREIDYKIYCHKRWLTRKYVSLKLPTVKTQEEKNKLIALWIYHPFSSRFDLPVPNAIRDIVQSLEKK